MLQRIQAQGTDKADLSWEQDEEEAPGLGPEGGVRMERGKGWENGGHL